MTRGRSSGTSPPDQPVRARGPGPGESVALSIEMQKHEGAITRLAREMCPRIHSNESAESRTSQVIAAPT
jgi:hypothetical protein